MVYGKILLAVDTDKRLWPRDMVYLSSWTSSFNIQFTEEEARATACSPGPTEEMVSGDSRYSQKSADPLVLSRGLQSRWDSRIIGTAGSQLLAASLPFWRDGHPSLQSSSYVNTSSPALGK